LRGSGRFGEGGRLREAPRRDTVTPVQPPETESTMSIPSSTPRGANEQSRLLKKIWKTLSPEDRVLAVRAATRDKHSHAVHNLRAAVMRTLRMRPVTVQAWSPQQLADAAGRIALEDEVIADLLVTLHLKERVALLTAFLDAAGVPHTEGATDPDAAAGELDADRVKSAAEQVLKDFPADQCRIYFATLIALEGGAWETLRPFLGDEFA
jgi:hypothetical protein